MKCPSCGAESPDGSLFCSNCGAPLPTEEGNAPTAAQDAQPAAQQNTTMLNGQPVPPAASGQQGQANQQGYYAQPGQQGYNQPGQPQPYAAYAATQDQGLSTGMKVLWAFVGAIIGLIGVLIAYLVNKNKGEKSKSDALKFSLIGFAIEVVLSIILAFSGVALTTAIIGSAANNASNTTATQPADNGSSSANNGSSANSNNGSSSSSSNSGSTATTPSTTSGAYFDSFGGVTVNALINLSGADLATQVESNGYKYSDTYEGWISNDYDRTLDCGDADDNWIHRDIVTAQPAGLSGSNYFYMITNDKNYQSFDAAIAGLVNVNIQQTYVQIDNGYGLQIVSNNAGQRFLLMESYTSTDTLHSITLYVFPESFITSGSLNKYLGSNAPTTLDGIWNSLAA